MIDATLPACLVMIALWGLIGLAGELRPTSLRYVGLILFPLDRPCGLALAVVAAMNLGVPAEQAVLPIGLPDLPVHVRRDALGAVSAGISVIAAGYFRRGHGSSAGLLRLRYHLFLAGMGLVLLANDAYALKAAWETMALSCYFLVTTQHSMTEIRSAGFLPADRTQQRLWSLRGHFR